MVLDRDKLKKLLKEKSVKSLEDFNAFMRDVSKDVIETLLDEELTDHLGFEKYDQKAKAVDNSRNGSTPPTISKYQVVFLFGYGLVVFLSLLLFFFIWFKWWIGIILINFGLSSYPLIKRVTAKIVFKQSLKDKDFFKLLLEAEILNVQQI